MATWYATLIEQGLVWALPTCCKSCHQQLQQSLPVPQPVWVLPFPQVHSHRVYKDAVGITVQVEYLILKSMQALPYSVQANCIWSTVSINESHFTLKGWQKEVQASWPSGEEIYDDFSWGSKLKKSLSTTASSRKIYYLLKPSASFTMLKSTGLQNSHK